MIKRIIEDPFFLISTESIFIQAADVIAFTLKERIPTNIQEEI
jgi:hypothetical protein